MNKSDRTILRKIIEEADTLARILHGCDKCSFLSSDLKMRASNMTLINIGELVKNLSESFRNEYKHFPWREIAGFRDVAAHAYFSLRMDDVWIYASSELPEFANKIQELLDYEEETQ